MKKADLQKKWWYKALRILYGLAVFVVFGPSLFLLTTELMFSSVHGWGGDEILRLSTILILFAAVIFFWLVRRVFFAVITEEKFLKDGIFFRWLHKSAGEDGNEPDSKSII